MRIKSIKIVDKAYKNLDINLDNNTSSIIAFIGNNGSGKSNVLEAISIIFKYLYQRKDKEIPFDFSLTYEIGGGKLVEITKSRTTVITKINGVQKSDPYSDLPKQVVAIYSGEEDRLWRNHYEPMYNDFISKINKGSQVEIPKMLYLNKFYWPISLLCLLLNRSNNSEDKFCEDILGINKVHAVKFEFNKNVYQSYLENNVLQFVRTIDSKNEYNLAELQKAIINYDISDVFKYLYIAFTPKDRKILQNITIKYNDENLEIEDFSEGEKKMILIKAALEFAAQEDSLFILDEPDAHIHLSNKMQIKKVLEEYERNRQVIITTHSPTLTDCLDNASIYMLDRGKLISTEKQKVLEDISGEFWNRFQQNTFISSKSPIILLVEGKLDKIHINNAYKALKEEYSDLRFDIFCLNSETKIQPFLSGLYESDFETDKLYIGLFDREKKLLDNLKNPKNYQPIEGKNFFRIIENNNKKNTNYFVTVLPEIEGKKCDCSIEMMYEYLRWEEAYQRAVKNTLGKTQNKSISEYSEDVLQDAKNILSEDSNSFEKEDFKNFRNLFDLIRDIVYYANALKNNTKKEHKKTKISKPQSNALPENCIEIITKTRNTDALAWYNTETREVVLKKGSKLALDIVPSYKKYERQRIEGLKESAEQKGEYYILKEDKKFDSASTAASFVIGRTANGWKEWKIKENNNLLDTIRIKE
jgi:hypothetical protein